MFDIFNLAYLDAGTGSLIIQSIIGVIAGVSVFGRNAIARIGDKTKKLFGSGTDKSGAKSEAKVD